MLYYLVNFNYRVHLVFMVLLERLEQLVLKETEVPMDHKAQEVKLVIAENLANLALKVESETEGYQDVAESKELRVPQ